MYTPLTKVVTVGEQEFITCSSYGTKMCRIHNPGEGAAGCHVCPVFAAMLNQLHAFEEVMLDMSKTEEEKE